ncbi:MAG: IclR family transcriptional regulator, partial [Actinomycetota bacterium]
MSSRAGALPAPDLSSPGSAATEGSAVKSLDRAVAILNAFSMERPELAMSEISRLTGLTTSTTHRLLGALQAHGLVRQVGARRYALGPQLRRLARAASVQSDVQDAARPIMQTMRDEGGETVGLHILDPSNQRVVIDQLESHEPLRRTYTELGQRIPLNQGAPGKVLLAHLPPEARDKVLS